MKDIKKGNENENQKISLIFYSEEDGKRTLVDKWSIEIGKKYTIGRSKKKVDISIQDITISRIQAEFIFYDKDKIMIKDFDSSNGTYINKDRILPKKERYFSIKDIISIGDEKNELIFEIKENKKEEQKKYIRDIRDDFDKKENKKKEEKENKKNNYFKNDKLNKEKKEEEKKNISKSNSNNSSYDKYSKDKDSKEDKYINKYDKYNIKDKYNRDRDYKYNKNKDYKYDRDKDYKKYNNRIDKYKTNYAKRSRSRSRSRKDSYNKNLSVSKEHKNYSKTRNQYKRNRYLSKSYSKGIKNYREKSKEKEKKEDEIDKKNKYKNISSYIIKKDNNQEEEIERENDKRQIELYNEYLKIKREREENSKKINLPSLLPLLVSREKEKDSDDEEEEEEEEEEKRERYKRRVFNRPPPLIRKRIIFRGRNFIGMKRRGGYIPPRFRGRRNKSFY